jgi:hypothetical protein
MVIVDFPVISLSVMRVPRWVGAQKYNLIIARYTLSLTHLIGHKGQQYVPDLQPISPFIFGLIVARPDYLSSKGHTTIF